MTKASTKSGLDYAAKLVIDAVDASKHVPTIRIILEGGIIQDVEIVNGSVQYLEIEVVDVDDNREEGLPDYEISTTLILGA